MTFKQRVKYRMETTKGNAEPATESSAWSPNIVAYERGFPEPV
jgi:hypothetical protein